MASLRQYFETDFSNTLRVCVRVDKAPDSVEAVLHYDLLAHAAFLSCWVQGGDLTYDELAALVNSIKHGESQLRLDGKVMLPEVRLFPGDLKVHNTADFNVRYRLYGDPEWRSSNEIRSTSRVFLYSEADLEPPDVERPASGSCTQRTAVAVPLGGVSAGAYAERAAARLPVSRLAG